MAIFLTAILTAPWFACGADGSDVGHRQPPTTIVFLGGCKTHAPGAHEHLRGAQLLKQCLDTASGIPRPQTRIYLDTWPSDPAAWDDAATIVLTWEGWNLHLVNARHPDQLQKLDQLMKRGVGLVCFHAATAVEKNVESYYLDWVGGVAPARAAGETDHRVGDRAGGWRAGLRLHWPALPCELAERRFPSTGAQRDSLDGQGRRAGRRGAVDRIAGRLSDHNRPPA